MSDHRFVIDPPQLTDPHLVVMLDGWIDASGAAAAAMGVLAAETDARELVSFDDDAYIDYRARRPTFEIREGVSTRLVWSSPELRHGKDRKGADVLLLSGPEPDMAWHRFADTIASLAQQLGVRSMTALGAYPYAAPHTRPVGLSTTSPSRDVVQNLGFSTSSVDVPAGVAAAIEMELHDRDIKAVGLWAQVPHYVSAMSYPAASIALLDALSRISGIALSADDLRRDVAVQRERLDHLVASNPEHVDMLGRLESAYDDAHEAGDMSTLEMRSGDDLAAEVEQFLRDHPKG
ncbi:PAC2 family protein [soil metagenome]